MASKDIVVRFRRYVPPCQRSCLDYFDELINLHITNIGMVCLVSKSDVVLGLVAGFDTNTVTIVLTSIGLQCLREGLFRDDLQVYLVDHGGYVTAQLIAVTQENE